MTLHNGKKISKFEPLILQYFTLMCVLVSDCHSDESSVNDSDSDPYTVSDREGIKPGTNARNPGPKSGTKFFSRIWVLNMHVSS